MKTILYRGYIIKERDNVYSIYNGTYKFLMSYKTGNWKNMMLVIQHLPPTS